MAVIADYPQYTQGPELAENTRDMTVALLRERIARDEYEVDSQAVAGAILERLLAVSSAISERDERD